MPHAHPHALPRTVHRAPQTAQPGHPPAADLLLGHDPSRRLDAVLVNAPLRDYAARPRVNDFTLPVLGMAYIATYARQAGFNVAVLDAEAAGLPVAAVIDLLNAAAPAWAGFNLLAPTYELSARIADQLDPGIMVMLGGHQAKAMPAQILTDPRMRACRALVLGEAETRAAALLHDYRARAALPGVMWLDPVTGAPVTGGRTGGHHHLAPDLDALPVVDRAFLAQDPYPAAGRIEANMVGARGCPYDCSFCGAAVSANPDVSIRARRPGGIVAEMTLLRDTAAVTAFRFVDDLFLGARRIIEQMMAAFTAAGVGDWAVWDATGRINVLDRLPDAALDTLARNGLREVALGIESGSQRMLERIDKRITPPMVCRVVERLTARGIGVKGYFILGLPTETRTELAQTVALVHDLWAIADRNSGAHGSGGGGFRASVFEFRPYPGTPEWDRLLADGYTAAQLLDYAPVDLTGTGADPAMADRDEFNFSCGLQFGEPTLPELRATLVDLTRRQHARNRETP